MFETPLLFEEVPEMLRVVREVPEELEEAFRKPVPDALIMVVMGLESKGSLAGSPARSASVLRCLAGGSGTAS